MRDRARPPLRPFWWEDDALAFVDQRVLPAIEHRRAGDVGAVTAAIEAGAIAGDGSTLLCAAFGVVLARRQLAGGELDAAIERLRGVLPVHASTAAMERVRSADVEQTRSVAHALVDEQQAVERAIARHALDLLPQAGAVLTHGATGALATGGVGTAVGAIVAARAVGRAIEAYVIDGSQGWRSTAFELQNAEVPIAVVPAAGVVALLRGIEIAAILVGATAILANGDVIAQLGTATLAGAAAARGVPVFVTAGRSTFGRDCASATLDRYRDILWHPATPTVAGDGSPAEALNRGDRNDLTPARFITAFVTEYGVSRPPYDESLPALAQRPHFAALPRH